MQAKRSLFGTDGVRGLAGTYLSPQLATELGTAAVEVLEEERPQVLLVRDTRESGPMLEAALAAGVAAAGGDAWLAGVLPTPAAAILARSYGFQLAAVISASHNPYADNGIKFFDGRGRKLDDDLEGAIEELLAVRAGDGGDRGAGGHLSSAGAPRIGAIRELHGALDDYLRALQSHYRLDLAGRRVLLDCANGAAYRAAPAIFDRLGAEVIAINVEPDGRNINDRCGSTHMEGLATRMAAGEAEIGFAFDGDADRVLAVDATGQTRDGDELLALNALHLAGTAGGGSESAGAAGVSAGRAESGDSPDAPAGGGSESAGAQDAPASSAADPVSGAGPPALGVAVTVMTNYGFHLAMKDAGLPVATTPVGDRHVLRELLERGWRLGGEQSGHAIDTEFALTGDGISTALQVVRALGDRDLGDVRPFERMPQRLINVTVADRDGLDGADRIWRAIEAETAALEGRGRVLVRPSGTEPMIRVMVEAAERERADEICERLAALVERELSPS